MADTVGMAGHLSTFSRNKTPKSGVLFLETAEGVAQPG